VCHHTIIKLSELLIFLILFFDWFSLDEMELVLLKYRSAIA